MTRRKRRANPLRLIVLIAAVGVMLYVNQFVVPNTPPLFVPTPTPTRSPDSFLQEARAFAAEGRFTQAEAAYQQALQVDPKNITIYLELARLQAIYGKYAEAQKNAENAILLNPNSSLAHAIHGWALGLQGEYLPAQAELNKAIEMEPGNGLAYAYLAEVLALQKIEGKDDPTTLDKAIEASRKAV